MLPPHPNPNLLPLIHSLKGPLMDPFNKGTGVLRRGGSLAVCILRAENSSYEFKLHSPERMQSTVLSLDPTDIWGWMIL